MRHPRRAFHVCSEFRELPLYIRESRPVQFLFLFLFLIYGQVTPPGRRLGTIVFSVCICCRPVGPPPPPPHTHTHIHADNDRLCFYSLQALSTDRYKYLCVVYHTDIKCSYLCVVYHTDIKCSYFFFLRSLKCLY